MRRLVLLFALLCLGAGCSSGTSGTPKAKPRPTIYFLGDSITANYYSSTAARGFREDFTRAIGGRQVGIAGGPGFRASDVLVEAAQARPTAADTVVVEVGTNDLVKGTPLPELQQAYTQLIAAALARSGPHPTLLCVGIWDDPQLAAPYDAVMRQVCTAARGHWVPISELYLHPEFHGPAGATVYLGVADAFHPNDQGHAAIAERLTTAFHAARP